MLTIDRFHAAYHVPQGTPDSRALQSRLDRMVRERLPASIEPVGGTPAVDGAFYVIRRLHLNLWVDALAMDDREVAERWGKLLAGAVVKAILRGGDGVRRYEGAAGYAAAFLHDLLAGTAWSRWEYQQLRPVEGLPPGAAAAHLLASRPGLLLEVMERLAEAGSLNRLLHSLTEYDADLIWQDGLGFGGGVDHPLPEDAGSLIGGLAVTMPSAASGAGFRRARLVAYLQLSVAGRRREPDRTLAAVAHGLARLHQLMMARPALAVWQALAAGEVHTPAALTGFLAGLDSTVPAAVAWLVQAMGAPSGPENVAALVSALRPGAGASETPPARPSKVETVASAFAGLAVLIPALRELAVYERGGRDAVYQLFMDAAGPDNGALVATDPGVRLLAGIEPADAERARRADVHWPELLPDGPNVVPGYLPVTLAALRRFAERLRGFEASSPEYLGVQFLRLPGHLELSEGGLAVTLHQAPLGLVLQMNGLTGHQGGVPWLDGRDLTINLPGSAG